jgi:uncharacterized protein YjiS (DUF1127 family)
VDRTLFTVPLRRATRHELLYGLWSLLVLWHERAHQRRALGRLDADRLHDIGRSRDEALQEAEKPFWRV